MPIVKQGKRNNKKKKLLNKNLKIYSTDRRTLFRGSSSKDSQSQNHHIHWLKKLELFFEDIMGSRTREAKRSIDHDGVAIVRRRQVNCKITQNIRLL